MANKMANKEYYAKNKYSIGIPKSPLLLVDSSFIRYNLGIEYERKRNWIAFT